MGRWSKEGSDWKMTVSSFEHSWSLLSMRIEPSHTKKTWRNPMAAWPPTNFWVAKPSDFWRPYEALVLKPPKKKSPAMDLHDSKRKLGIPAPQIQLMVNCWFGILGCPKTKPTINHIFGDPTIPNQQLTISRQILFKAKIGDFLWLLQWQCSVQWPSYKMGPGLQLYMEWNGVPINGLKTKWLTGVITLLQWVIHPIETHLSCLGHL